MATQKGVEVSSLRKHLRCIRLPSPPRRHVYKDLQPYMCTFDSCFKANTMFEKRREWFNHELQVHRREWCCNVNDHEAYQNKAMFVEHMERLHADSYEQAQLNSVVPLFERPATTTTASCPFCTREDTQGLSISRLAKHLARHMEMLALFALPHSDDTQSGASVESGLQAEASQGSGSDSKSKDVVEEPPESDSAVSANQIDFNPSESQPCSLFESILHSFCAVEAAWRTSMPKRFLPGENKDNIFQLQFQLQTNSPKLSRILSRKIDLLPDGDVGIADFLTDLHAECKAEYDGHAESVADLQYTVDNFIYELVKYVEYSMMTYHYSYESSENSSQQETKDRITQLRQDMQQTLVEERENGQATPSSDADWDYIQPKVSIASSTLALLSKALTTTHVLAQSATARALFRSGQINGLRNDLEMLIRTLNGTELKRKTADIIERKVWSEESAIAEYNCLATSPSPPDEGTAEIQLTRIRFVGPVMNVVHQVLEALDVPLEHQEPTEEPGNSGKDTEDFETVVSWIRGQSPDQSIRHKIALAAWQIGTSEWFFDSLKYSQWRRPVIRQLNVLGNAACGKTVLCAAVIERLRSQECSPKVGLAYYYWHELKDSNRQATDVLRSTTSQLCLQLQVHQELPPSLRTIHTRCIKMNVQPSYEDLSEVFAAIVRLYDTCFIVLDGLEHCSDYSMILEAVGALGLELRILITSRQAAKLGRSLLDPNNYPIPTLTNDSNVIIDDDHVAKDAAVMIRTKFESLMPQKASIEKTTSTILNQTHGMYVLANHDYLSRT